MQTHFPTSYNKIRPYIAQQYKRNWQNTLIMIAAAIERTYGRLAPVITERATFDSNRTKILEAIVKGKHFQEKPNCNFVDLVDETELSKTIDGM